MLPLAPGRALAPMMRAANRGGFAVESQLAAFYGPGNDYWAKTLKCADAPAQALPKPE